VKRVDGRPRAMDCLMLVGELHVRPEVPRIIALPNLLRNVIVSMAAAPDEEPKRACSGVGRGSLLLSMGVRRSGKPAYPLQWHRNLRRRARLRECMSALRGHGHRPMPRRCHAVGVSAPAEVIGQRCPEPAVRRFCATVEDAGNHRSELHGLDAGRKIVEVCRG
jgi:hypothetical protein